MKRIPQSSKQVLILLLFLFGYTNIYSQIPIRNPSGVPFQEVPGTNFNIRGELKMIGNNIISPNVLLNGTTRDPNDPFDQPSIENGSFREYAYIDIDGFVDENGDGVDDTFSSSSAVFERATTCGQIVYAGLYWSATYYDDTQVYFDHPDEGNVRDRDDYDPIYDRTTLGPDTRPPFNTIKIRPPGATTYTDILPADVRIIYDGYPGSVNNPNFGPNDTRPGVTANPSWPNIENAVVDMPYHCYADVTSILQGVANPDGEYFIANQRSSIGRISDTNSASSNDIAGGWVLVVIYEDQSLPFKYINSNNGVAAVSGSTGDVDFTYSGFTTVDPPLPVNARYGIGTYEGDQGIRGDRLRVEIPFGSNNFNNNLSANNAGEGNNLADNFFDSTITVDGANYLQREPDSENCLGFDVDIFDLQRDDTTNPIIANNQTAVNFRLISTGDKYQVFVNTFEVEIIAPEVVMTKRVLRADASEPSGFLDITDGDVNFNDEVFYDISIENVGNEDVTNVTIQDIIPVNVDFISFDLVDDGINPTFNAATFNPDGTVNTPASITLQIEDRVIQEGDPAIRFRFRVRVVADCASLRDACSNEIENVAISQYTGVESGITDGESSIVARDACNFNIVGASTFLINDDTCFNQAENARLCRGSVTLPGGGGFETYTWTREDDPSDPTFPRNTQDIVVTEEGTYVVIATSVDCRDTQRRFEVLPQSAPDNPIAQLIQNGDLDSNPNANGNVRICPSTSEELAEIFLCGSGVTVPLNSNLGAATVWERLVNGACPSVPRDPNCPTEDTTCDPEWQVVFTGNTLTLDPNNTALFPSGDASGEYRILTTVDGDCPEEIYFNVFQSNFDPVIAKVRDIICGTPGALEVTGTSSLYEYQLIRAGSPPVAVGGFQEETLFDNITVPGSYTVNAREIGSPLTACTFPSNSITINSINPDIDFDVTRQPSCATGDVNNTGDIEITVTGGLPTYRYRITGPTGFTPREITGSADPTAEFLDLLPGEYTLEAYADDDDSTTNCFATETLRIEEGDPFTVTITPVANLQCNPDFNPTPNPVPPGDSGPFDDDEYIAIVEVVITSTPASGNYQFSTNPDFSLTAFRIDPFDSSGGDTFRFRFNNTNLGTFTIYVRDAAPGAGCVTQGGTTINDAVIIEATASAIDPPCFNELGGISVNITNGTAPFTFLIDGAAATPATTPGSADGLGTYTFENIDPSTSPVVTAQNGGISCDIELPAVNFNVPDEIQITLGTITPLSCNANPNASIEVTSITGGSGNYEYSLDDPNGTYTPAPATPFTINNVVGAGAHVVYVRNVVTPPTPACRVSESFQIQPLAEVDLVEVTTGNLNCTAQTTEVTLSAQPATATYLFRVTPDPATGTGNTGFVATTSYTFENGTAYLVEARRTDSNCENNTTFTPADIPVSEIVNQRQTNPVSCNGGNDGAFEFTVTNSTVFNYTITGPGGTNITVNNNTTNPVVITGSPGTPIIVGTYTISITDTSLGAGSTGCTDTKTVTITQPDPITFTINPTNQDCATDLNEVSISNVSGGNGPTYTYQVSHPTNGTFGPVPATDAIDNIPNIPTGDPVPNYTVTVFDVTGTCSGEQPLTITPLTPLEAAIANTSDVCLDDGAVSLTVNINPNANGSTGTPGYTYTVSRDGTLVQNTTTLGSVSNFTTNVFSQSGNYEILLVDSEGCEVLLTETIAPLLTITAVLVNDLSCDPTTGADVEGEFELTISGGTANYDITFENTTTSTTGNVALGVTTTATPITFNSPDAGNYIFTVTDRAGSTGTRCVATDTGELTDRTTPTINAPDVDLLCEGGLGTVTITVTGPETEYFVLFDDNDATTTDTFVQTVSNQVQIPNLPAGIYNFIVRDSRGCRFPETVEVISPGPIVELSRIENPITCDDTVTPSTTRPGSISLTIEDRGALQYTYTLVDDSDVSSIPLIPSTNTSTPNPQVITNNTVLFEDVPAGQYYIFVEDINGCAERLGPFTVASDPSDLTIISTTVATCPDLVTLNVQVVDGVGPFIIEVFGPSGSLAGPDGPPLNGLPTSSGTPEERNHSVSNLPFNTTYEVVIEDTNTNCTYVQFVDPVPPPSMISLSDLEEFPISCNDGDLTTLPTDGAFDFTIDVITLGAGVTSVSWGVFNFGTGTPATGTDTTGSSGVGSDITVNVTDLPAGLYYVEVVEDDGTRCPVRVNFEIEVPDPIISTADNPRVAICDTEVAFSITTNGGTPTEGTITSEEGYRYSRVRRGDPVGPFTFDATTINDPFTIDPTDPLDLAWDIYTRDDNGCIEGPLEIDINVTPGPSIDVNPGFVSNPCALSDYTLTIQTSADPLALNSNGDIFYGYDDGVNPVTFDEAPPGNYTYTFPTPGTYTLIIRDNNGCTDTSLPITVFPRIEITAAFVTPPDCTTVPPLGVVETTVVSPGSGVANHTYSLLDAVTLLPVAGVVENPVGSGRFENVPAGSYVVRVEDSGMGDPGPPPVVCPFDTPVSIEAPTTPDIDTTTGVTDASCNVATPAPAPNTGLGDGRIEVSLVGGLDPTAAYQYAIVAAPGTGDVRPLQDSNIFNNLAPDTYTVRVEVTEPNGPGTTDDVLCFVEETYTVGSAPAIVLSVPAVTSFSCNPTDNSEQFPIITIDVSGGTLNTGGSYRVSYTRPAPLAPVVDEIVVDADAAPGIQFQTIGSVEGTYNFTFRDSNNCEISTSATVPPFNRLNNATVTVTAPGLTCAASEEVTISVEGGTTGDTFTFEEITGAGVTTQSAVPFDNNGATAVAETQAVFTLPNPADETRTYRFRITNDNTGCYVEVDHTVDRVDFLEVVAEQLNPERCFEDADGTIRITVSGYTFDDGTTITIGGGLDYVVIDPDTGVEVVDGGGLPIANSSGSLIMTTDPQTFDLPFGATQGDYIVSITQTDNPLCAADDSVVIQGPVELELIVPPFITTTCDIPLDNGSFTATTNGAQGTVTYTIIETGATSTDGTFTGLGPTDPTTPRTYTVVARDTFPDPTSPTGTSFCEDTATIEVRPPINDVVITDVTPTGVTCNEDTDGSIVVTATGTDVPLTYTITPVTTGEESDRTDDPNFTLLAPGDYIITVYDRSNCSDASGIINVAEPNPVTIIVDDVTDTTCAVTTADVTLTVTSDLAAPYTVEARDVTLRDVVSTPSNPVDDADRDIFVRQETTNAAGVVTFTGLPEGIYEFFAIDSNNCSSQRTGSVVIDAPDQITAQLDLENTNIVCFGDATGSVNLIATTGGLGNNVYYLDVVPEDTTIPPFPLGPQGDPFFTDLPAGQYTYRIESVPGSGCMFSQGFVITQPDTPFEAQAVPSNITCNGENDGTITVTATGGNINNPYRFSLFNSAGDRIFEFVSDEVDNTAGIHVFEDLTEDLTGYTVIVTDGLGCPVQIDNLIIEEPDPIIITPISSTPERCAGDENGTATFSITGGTPNPDASQPTYTYSINGSPFLPVTDPANLLLEDLPSGDNTLLIRDFNGIACETPRIFQIEPGVVLNAVLTNVFECPVIDPMTGSVTDEIYSVQFVLGDDSVDTDIIYTLIGINGTPNPIPNQNTTGIFENIVPGEYEGTMEHISGCDFTTDPIEVEEYEPLIIPVAQMTNNPQDPNEYEIIVSGGSGDYTYFVAIIPDGLTVNDLTDADYRELDDNIFSIDETAEYAIRVLDNIACEAIGVQELTYINIVIPNYFTPDGDGTNDVWYPRQDSPNPGSDPFFFSNMEVKVFDRYGRLLAEFVGEQQGWDGIYQGSELPSGDYWFTIILNDIDNREFTGHFTLYR